MWQLGTLVGAPVGIALIAGIAIPAMIIGIPVYVGRKVSIDEHCFVFDDLLEMLVQEVDHRNESIDHVRRENPVELLVTINESNKIVKK